MIQLVLGFIIPHEMISLTLSISRAGSRESWEFCSQIPVLTSALPLPSTVPSVVTYLDSSCRNCWQSQFYPQVVRIRRENAVSVLWTIQRCLSSFCVSHLFRCWYPACCWGLSELGPWGTSATPSPSEGGSVAGGAKEPGSAAGPLCFPPIRQSLASCATPGGEGVTSCQCFDSCGLTLEY